MQGAQQWYMAIGGHQVGPVSQEEILANLRNGSIDAETLVFTSGMANWQKLKDVPAFAAFAGRRPRPAARRAAAADGSGPPRPRHRLRDPRQRDAVRRGRARSRRGARSPKPASMMYMTNGIQLETIFGDGSQTAERAACSMRCSAPASAC